MVPLILRVEVEGELVEVPLTPVTTCRDVIDCIRDPGPEHCLLVHSPSCKVLKENDKPLEVLQRLGSHEQQPSFTLRYTLLPPGGGSPDRRNGMKETDSYTDSVWRAELSVAELEAMAMRQQEEMASGRALLAAKEARLRALKQQQGDSAQRAHEQERLRRLRDRVQAQEHKLSKLRALRGQLDHTKLNNATLTSDLESIKALFNEKEKELTLAVAKVEELTRQLEEVRRGKGNNNNQTLSSPAQLHEQHLELERLRRELMYRNKLNEQQSLKLSEQQEMLCQRQLEMASIDKRIAELQERLHRKRLLNQQLANQINSAAAANNNQSNNQNQSPSHPPKYNQSFSSIGKPILRNVTTGNIAAVEPYHHVPSYQNSSPVQENLKPNNELMRPDTQPGLSCNGSEDIVGVRKQSLTAPATHHYIHETTRKDSSSTISSTMTSSIEKQLDNQDLWRKEVALTSPPTDPNHNELSAPSKQDPKYQTLPYNTRFSPSLGQSHPPIKSLSKRGTGEGNENISEPIDQMKNGTGTGSFINGTGPQQVAHSIPIASKGLALGPNRFTPQSSVSPSSASSASSNCSFPPHTPYSNRIFSGMPVRGQPVGGASSTTSSTSSLATTSSGSTNSPQVQNQPVSRLSLPPTPLISDTQKPISAVTPTLQNPSSFFQTSSTKIHPVQPQTINTQPQVILKEESETSKPALPPKPAFPGIKATPPPPPRQTHAAIEPLPPSRIPVLDSNRNDHQQQRVSGIDSRPPPPSGIDIRPPTIDVRSPTIDVSAEAVDNALTVLRGTYNNNNRSMKDDDGRRNEQAIKPRPLTIRKQPPSDMPRLRNQSQDTTDFIDTKRRNSNEILDVDGFKPSRLNSNLNGNDSSEDIGNQYRESRRIEMPPAFLFPETPQQQRQTQDDADSPSSESHDDTDRSAPTEDSDDSKDNSSDVCIRRTKKGNLKGCSGEKTCLSRRVSFDPLALLLDAALEGELELVIRTAAQVKDPSAANDEGITALHNAICAGHFDIVTFLVEFGCDVNAQDSDGWTPLHCAASCNNLAMVKFLVEHGACIFATTLSDHETAAEKCEEDEEGFDGCSEYLYSVQEKLGIMNSGIVYAVYDYEAHNNDELSFKEGDKMVVIRKGDEWEREWWWTRLSDKEGYIPRNLLGLYPRVTANKKSE